MTDRPEIPYLHIHGPWWPHDDARIVGNREGLEALRAAITAALEKGSGSCRAYVIDGEGFDLEISRTNGPGLEGARLPYLDPVFAGDAGIAKIIRAMIEPALQKMERKE